MGRPKCILIVDDDQRVLFVLREALARLGEGYDIVTAEDGLLALDKVRHLSVDLIVTDLKLPGMDGIELTRAARDLDPDILIVWITAHGCYRVAEDAKQLAVRRCLDKPLEIGELRRIVKEVLPVDGPSRLAQSALVPGVGDQGNNINRETGGVTP